MEERGREGLALWGNEREGRKPMEGEGKIPVERGRKNYGKRGGEVGGSL